MTSGAPLYIMWDAFHSSLLDGISIIEGKSCLEEFFQFDFQSWYHIVRGIRYIDMKTYLRRQ